MDTKKAKRINKNNLEPIMAPGSEVIITKEDIEKRKRRIARAEEIGQSLTRVTAEEYENPYRAEAMLYILQDKEVPEELKEKIRVFDEQHNLKEAKESLKGE